MMKKLYMYLFFFAVLFIIFQYTNEKGIFEAQEKKIANLQAKVDKANDSIVSLNEQLESLKYFSLQGNENAMSYIESLGFEVAAIETLVHDKIYDQNALKGTHPLIPYEGVEGDFKINTIRFLNHRWIIADFTDGKHWGESIFEFFITEKNEIEIKEVTSVLYPL